MNCDGALVYHYSQISAKNIDSRQGCEYILGTIN
jgi:hypothetical protein